eukprot:763463-Hanusia_phi.AAC.2
MVGRRCAAQAPKEGRRWLEIASTNSQMDFSIAGQAKEGRSAFLDNQSTTALDPRVLDAMMPLLTWQYGNPHSRSHHYGWEVEELVEEARGHVAQLIGAEAKEIVFTSGATECNNMAIKGVARFYGAKKKHIITTQTEHKCVLDSCRVLQNEGFEITYLPVQANGLINLDTLRAAIRPDTALVSVMAVNNEIGVIQPMVEIGKICRENKVFFHSDIAQAAGKIDVNVNQWNLDLASISGHKIYGPKGVGALYIRRRPRVRCDFVVLLGGMGVSGRVGQGGRNVSETELGSDLDRAYHQWRRAGAWSQERDCACSPCCRIGCGCQDRAGGEGERLCSCEEALRKDVMLPESFLYVSCLLYYLTSILLLTSSLSALPSP